MFSMKIPFLIVLLVCFAIVPMVLAQAPPLDSTALADAKTYKSLEEALKSPQRVYKLTIRRNKLTQLSPEIGLLANLQSLDVSANDLTRLPREIGNLRNLEELNLSYNDFGSIPPEIFSLTNLRRLNLVRTGLTELPPEIANLKDLTYLTVVKNGLTRIPEEFGEFTMLESLYLDENRLESLPASIGNLENLDVLSLNHNRLTAVPPEIANLENLTVLELSGNQLTEVPSSIAELEKLRDLDLTENRLTHLPSELSDLLQLPVVRGQRDIGRMNPNRRFVSTDKPLFGPDGAIQMVTSQPLPTVLEISDLVNRIEAMEMGQMSGEPPEEVDLDRAVAGLAAHLEAHPDDVQALILTARLGRFLNVSEPVVLSRGDEAPSFEAAYLPLHTALDHAIRLEPANGEAYYWKARLYGMRVPDLSTGVMAYRNLDLEQAIAFAAQAVDLDPGNTAYREAHALYLVAAGKYGEAMEATRPADGGKNPIYLLLSDLENFPIPEAARFLPEESKIFAEFQANRGRYPNYPDLRVRIYSFSGPVSELEAMFREFWPGIELYEMDRTEGPDEVVMVYFWQHFRWREGDLRPIGSKRKLEKLQKKNAPGGIMLSVVEWHRPSEEVRIKYGEPSADPFSVIAIMNDTER